MKTERIDHIVCLHLLTTGPLGLLFRLTRKRPYHVFVFGAEFKRHPLLHWLKHIVLRFAQGIIVISNFTAAVVGRQGPYRGKITIVTPGVDIEQFSPGPRDLELVEKLRLEGKKVIFTVCRLERYKGVDTALKVLPSLLERVGDVVYIVGGTGPYGDTLRRHAEALGLRDRVLFAGFIPDEDLAKYYNLCDVFLLLTREDNESGNIEGFGIVFLEANACEKPVIGGRTGGATEAIADGVTGFLVDPLNLNEIEEKLYTLLADEELARTLGRQGRERVKASFRREAKARSLLEAIRG